MGATICRWSLLIWSVLIFLGVGTGFMNFATSVQGEVTTAQTIGVILGLGTWCLIWLAGAVPLLIVYLFVKK